MLAKDERGNVVAVVDRASMARIVSVWPSELDGQKRGARQPWQTAVTLYVTMTRIKITRNLQKPSFQREKQAGEL